MTEFIILSRRDIMTLCKDEPVKIWIDKRPMLLCSDEYFERQKADDKHMRMNNNCGQYYSGRTENDEHKAVELLDKFTKEFCIDATVADDLEFRCKECTFQCEDGRCLVKGFKCKFAPEYKDFGSMGDL